MSSNNHPSGPFHRGEGLQAILDSIPAQIFVKDLEGRYTLVNRTMAEATGIPAENWIGKTLLEVVPGSAPTYQVVEDEIIRTGLPRLGIVEVFDRPEGRAWIQVDKVPLRNDRGELTGVICTALDVTAREQALAAMRESELSFRMLFEHSTAGILLTKQDGSILEANSAACRLFGMSEEEICRAGRSGIVDPADQRLGRLRDERANKGFAQGELTCLRAGGSSFDALVSTATFRKAEGQLIWVLIQDLTEQKAEEQRIHDFSQKLLQVREEERRRLSAALHHELGSFSVGMMTRVDAAEDELRAGRTHEALAALTECHGLFVDSFERLKTMAMELRPPDLDLLGLVAALRRQLKRMASDAHLEIRFVDGTRATPIPPEIEITLFRVVHECATNAVRHAVARRLIVRLSAPGHTFLLTVKDDGRGFVPEDVAGLPGTHLGLQTMRELVAAHGGHFSVKSAPGKGTSVEVVIPQGTARP